MSRTRMLRRRAGAHRGLLLLVVTLVAAITAATGVTMGAVQSAAGATARQALLDESGETVALAVTTRLAGDAAAQEERAREIFGHLLGPVSVTRTEIPDGAQPPFVEWTVAPDLTTVSTSSLGRLADGAADLRMALRDDAAVAVRGVTVEGDLGAAAREAHAALGATQAVATIPVVILLLVALVAGVQVARLLAATRADEVTIAVTRGASPRQLGTASFLEATVVVLAAVTLGSAGAAAVLAARGELDLARGALGAVAAGVAVAGVTVLTVVAVGQARALSLRQVTDRSGRLRQAAALGTVVLTVVAAVVCTVQLRRYGSPLIVASDGVSTDPLAAAAPALLLAVSAVVGLALLGPVTRVGAMLAARGPGATAVLASRQVARRLQVVVVPVVLLMLAAGTAVLAAAYTGTSERTHEAAASQAVGADVRVALPGGARVTADNPPPSAAPVAQLDDVRSAFVALVADATVGGDPLGLLAVPGDAARDRSPAVGDAGLFAGSPEIPAGADELVVSIRAQAEVDVELLTEFVGREPGDVDPAEELSRQGIEVAAWVAAGDGSVRILPPARVPGADLLDEQRLDLSLALPESGDASRLVALDVAAYGSGTFGTRFRVDVAGLAAATDGGLVELERVSWLQGIDSGLAESEQWSSDPVTITEAPSVAVTSGEPWWVRFEPAEAPRDVPAVVSEGLAARLDLAVGDVVEAAVAGVTVPLHVIEVVPTLSGVPGDGAMVTLGSLNALLLHRTADPPRPAEIWVDAVPGADVDALVVDAAELARAQAPGPGEVTTSTVADASGGVDAAAPVRSTFVLAAVGAAALALVGVAAVSVAGLRSRRGEVVVLRAVGEPPRRQGAGRAAELGVVGLVSIGFGALAGWVIVLVVVPGLVSATLGATSVPIALSLDAAVLVWPVAALVTGLALVAGVVGRLVTAQARDTTHREEVR